MKTDIPSDDSMPYEYYFSDHKTVIGDGVAGIEYVKTNGYGDDHTPVGIVEKLGDNRYGATLPDGETVTSYSAPVAFGRVAKEYRRKHGIETKSLKTYGPRQRGDMRSAADHIKFWAKDLVEMLESDNPDPKDVADLANVIAKNAGYIAEKKPTTNVDYVIGRGQDSVRLATPKDQS